jgi:hypothetical protein
LNPDSLNGAKTIAVLFFGNGERYKALIDKMPRCYDADGVQIFFGKSSLNVRYRPVPASRFSAKQPFS